MASCGCVYLDLDPMILELFISEGFEAVFPGEFPSLIRLLLRRILSVAGMLALVSSIRMRLDDWFG
jgi:hypothetical protein